ncbi:MAG: bifunctional folylpolyglutamate synthase/dihydrofolate synthase [Bacilli bacterium]
MGPLQDASDALAYIQSRLRFGVKPGLERTAALLDRLDHPERPLRFIHVAGTNGKGSTCVFLAAVLQKAGFRVGLYTSPSLASFAERIAVDGVPIGGNELWRCTVRVKDAADPLADTALDPTEFEIATAIAFLHFASCQCDIVVLETGLGGRYDATNVVTPEVSIITNVELDHTAILGSHPVQIARDKAGVVKPGRPVVTAAQGGALRVIEERAAAASSAAYRCGREFAVVSEGLGSLAGHSFSYFGVYQDVLGLRTRMLGLHQLENAATALCALELLARRGFGPSVREAMREGVARARLPGRLEVLSHAPLVLLDGAHNPAGARALAAALHAFARSGWLFVVGVFADKDIGGVVAAVAGTADAVIVAQPRAQRAAAAESVAKHVRSQVAERVPVWVIPDVSEALDAALAVQSARGCAGVCVFGSLSTVSEARQAWMRRI